MGNRESKDAAAHAARLAEEAETKPSAVAADLEAHNQARAKEQGGRWLEKDTAPHKAHSQKEQPAVREAVKAAHKPEAQEKEALREAARHQASGGRW